MEPAGCVVVVVLFLSLGESRLFRLPGLGYDATPWERKIGRPRMSFQARMLCAAAISGFAALVVTGPAQALTMQECSAKYKAARDAGTLKGQKWNDFRKAQCGADATPAAATTTAPAAPAAPAAPPPATTAKKEAAPAAAPAPAGPSGPAVYPN